MNLQWVRERFDGDPAEYDAGLERFIPHYAVQNEMFLAFVPFQQSENFRLLQVGAGTGVLPHLVLEHFPNSSAHVVDMTEESLAVARRRLAAYGDRVTYQAGHLGVEDLGGGANVVFSDLALHHLGTAAKRAVYRRIYESLTLSGMFLNRDLVYGATETLTWHYERLWRLYLQAQGQDDVGLLDRSHAEDTPASVDDQLEWLRSIGFVDVGCHWRFLNFAIFGGQKGFRH